MHLYYCVHCMDFLVRYFNGGRHETQRSIEGLFARSLLRVQSDETRATSSLFIRLHSDITCAVAGKGFY
jgi:hypothetical protein